MRWFGTDWGAPVCREGLHVATPVGELCGQCTQPIKADDQGLVLVFYDRLDEVGKDFPVHLDCLIENVAGRPPPLPSSEARTA